MSEAKALIQRAKEAIGAGDSATDWRVVPTEHAELYADTAPPLADTLRASSVKGVAEIYEERNHKAVGARNEFKKTVSRADFAIFLSASFSAGLLIVAGLQGILGDAGPWVIGIIGVLALIAGSFAAMLLSQINQGGLADRWASERAKAEAKRLTYFKKVMQTAPDTPTGQLLALEYVRRYLLDNQIDYFRDRGDQHDKKALLALKQSTQAVFMASICTGAAGLFSILVPQLAVIAGLGVIASALAKLIESQTTVNMDRVNAERYQIAKEQLRERKLELDAYREKVAAGEPGAVQKFFEPIFVALEVDHKAFLDDSEQRELAIGNMETRLEAAREELTNRQQPDDESA